MMLPHAIRRNLPILRQVTLLALPVMFANLLQSLVNVVDVFMAGRLGPIEIAAVGMSTTIRMLIFIMVLSVTAGAMALAAQAKGARDPQKLSFVARQSLTLTVLLGALLSITGYFIAEPLLGFLNSGGDPRAVILGTEYLQLLFIGTTLLIGNFLVNSLMQGAGDTLTPLFLSGGVNLLNIGFNVVFMFGLGPVPAFGVAGAAMGTLAARFIGMIIGVGLLYSSKSVIRILPGSYIPDWQMFKDILSIGIPSGLQGMVRNSAQLLVIRIVTSTAAGTFGAAALAIGFQVESLAFMPGLGINVAATSLVGQALGAWQVRDAKKRGSIAIMLGILVMSSISLPLIIFAPQIILLFDPSAHPTVVAAGTSYLRIYTFFQPVLAIGMVTNGALRGAGDTRPGLFGNIYGRWLVAVPLAYILALPLGFGVEGVWWALAVGTTVAALYVLRRWLSEAWVEVALHKTSIYRQHLQHLSLESRQQFLERVRSPLMAAAGTIEVLEPNSVHYRNDQQHVIITFDYEANSYHISQGQQWLKQLQRQRPLPVARVAPAYD